MEKAAPNAGAARKTEGSMQTSQSLAQSPRRTRSSGSHRSPASKSSRLATLTLAAGLLFVQGCALTPKGLEDERAALDAASPPDAVSHAELPRPSSGDDWRGFLRRGLVANGGLHAAWFEWKAAVERVSGASGWPNTNLALGFSTLFSDEGMKGFDRMTFEARFDSMENLSFPTKTMRAGDIALEEARAAGQRFRAAKFRVQREVLDAWLDLAMAAENERLALEKRTLSGVAADTADAAIGAGAPQGASLTARIGEARGDDEVARARAEVAAAKAVLAAATAIDDPEGVPTPTRLPRPRTLPARDALLFQALDATPDIAGLEADVRTREHEAALARLQWIPDINPLAMVTGTIEQAVGAMVMLPTTIPEIRSGIEVARAMRSAADAELEQGRRDQRGALVAALVALRDVERGQRLLEERVLPAALAVASAATSAYTASSGELGEVVEARLLAVETRMEIAALTIERERRVAEIEEILGADLETFTNPELLHVARAGVVPGHEAAEVSR